jgi:acyl dehydratase
MTICLTELRALIGQEATYTAPEEIGRASARYYARAIGDDNRLYADPAAARDMGLPSTIVPPTWLFETNQYADLPPNEDGYAGHWPIELPGTRAVRGGNSYHWYRDVYPDDIVTAHWRITDITERTTKNGEPMVVVTSSCHYTDHNGEPIAAQTETLIFVDLHHDATH